MVDISRRQFLKIGGLAGVTTTGAIACGPTSPEVFDLPTTNTAPPLHKVSYPTETFDPTIHLLNRITFGPRPGDTDRVNAMGHTEFIEEQLSPKTVDTSRADKIISRFDTLNPAGLLDTLKRLGPRPVFELNAATLARALYSEQQLYEVMVDFWSNHFSIYSLGMPARILKIVDDRDVIRPHALGSFRELLGASAHSPAMLYYLDNYTNSVEGPNENYARELLELHTLGPNGGYTQDDVVNVSRAFTGWTIGRAFSGHRGEFQFSVEDHDNKSKIVLGHIIPPGGGEQEGELILDILAAHPGTAHNISRKLCIRFISDTPSEETIKAVAVTFSQTGGNIRAVLRTILNSDEFKNSAGAKVKRPLEFIVSMLRTLDVDVQNFRPVVEALRDMGQVIFGWPAPDGYPDYATAWINTNALLKRWNLALRFVELSGQQRPLRFDLLEPFHAARPKTSQQVLQLYSNIILNRPLPEHVHPIFLELLQKNPDKIEDNLPLVTALLFASPYFQYK
jgi:uncharacterized protein (DUF1800 family)